MKKQWTDEIREKLRDYETPVMPEGLWDDISSEMSSRKVVPLHRHWFKVCAAIALLLIPLAGSWFILHDDVKPVIVERRTPPLIPSQSLLAYDNAIEMEENTTAKVANRPVKVISDAVSTETASSSETISAEIPSAEDVSAEVAVTEIPVSQAKPQEGTSASSMQYVANTEKFRKEESDNKSVSFALNASGLAVGSIANGPVSYNNELMYDDAIQSGVNSNPTYQGSAEIYKEKHHRPITVGLQVGVPLSNRLSVNTGVNYTYLYSEFDKGIVHTDQKLHYIGVPAMLNYSVYQNNVLGAYIGAGGIVSFGVSGKSDKHWLMDGVLNSTSEKLQDMPIYISPAVSLGVQWNMFKGLNLYAEPSLQYNISNSSKYSTFYSEHTLLFDLRFGLRWNLSK